MRILAPLLALSCASISGLAQTPSPVLAWSARVGPELRRLTGVLPAPGGGVFLVGETISSEIAGTSAFRNSSLYVGKVAADGSANSCSYTMGGDGDDRPAAVASAPDGTVFVAGMAAGPNFPTTPGVAMPKAEDPFSPFLVRLDPCGTVRYSTFLPKKFRPSALASAADGGVFVVAADRTMEGRSQLFKLDPQGRRIVAHVVWNGLAGAMAVDPSGSVYVAGVRDTRAVITRFTPDLQRMEFDNILGNETVSMSTALAIAPDGSLWVAGFAAPPGIVPNNHRFTEFFAYPIYDNLAATLTRMAPDGAVVFRKIVELSDQNVTGGLRFPTSIGAGPDGRIWVAIAGPAGFPQTSPSALRTPVHGAYLRSFDADGQPAGGETLIPGLRPGSAWPVASFAADGRLTVASLNRFLPVTPGSADSGLPASASLVAFDLALPGAPVIDLDRELLDVDTVYFAGKNLLMRKAVNASSRDAEGLRFIAAVVPDASQGTPRPGTPQPAFMTPDFAGEFPASIRVAPLPDGEGNGVLVLLAPGAQGLPAIPVRARRFNANWRMSVSPVLETSAPGSEILRSTLFLDSQIMENVIVPFPVPFSVTTDTRWLRLEQSEGTTPAEIPFTVDTTGLSSGTHSAQMQISYDGQTRSFPITLTVGPVLRFDGSISDIPAPFGQTVTHKFTIRSSSAPLDLTLASRTSWLQVSPASGRTPLEITLTATPPSTRPGERLGALIDLVAGDTPRLLGPTFLAKQGPLALPDSIERYLAPGGLFSYAANTSRCEAVVPQAPPWPLTLGGCTLRLNGRPLPLAGIAAGTISGYSGDFYLPSYLITTQLPYDVAPGRVDLELEDRDGRKTSLPAEVLPWQPSLRGKHGLAAGQPFLRRPGEEFTLRISGMGAMNGPAPWGDVPADILAPLAPLSGFIGGRPAPILSAELSRTEVGIVELRVQVPPIAPDAHYFNLRVAGQDVYVGKWIVVTGGAP